MKLTPLQKRAQRKARHQSNVDLNLVALIDIFTILLFFLLSAASGIEILSAPRSVKLPQSTAETAPRDTVVVVVSPEDILVEGRRVATVAEAMNTPGDLIAPLEAELDGIASRQVVRAENAAQGRTLTIMGDKDIPYALLRKVMATAARANFADVSFAVTRKYEVSS